MATNGIDSGVETGNESNDVEIGMMNSPSESDSSYDNKIPPPPPTSPESSEGPGFSGSFFDPPQEQEDVKEDLFQTEEMDRDLDDFVPESSSFDKSLFRHYNIEEDKKHADWLLESASPVLNMESIPIPMSSASFCPPPAPPVTPTMVNQCKALIKFEFPELPKLVCQFVEPPAGFRNFVSTDQFQGEKGFTMKEARLVVDQLCETNALIPYEQRDITRKLKCFTRSSLRARLYDDWASGPKEHCERRLRSAANSGNLEFLNRLLHRGVNPNAGDDHGRTPLHLASCKGYTEIVKSLLQSGANPYQKDILGNTPLHLASCTNHIQVVTCLLRAGTDVMALDNNGRNPLQLAQSKLKLLASSSGKFESGDSGKIKREVHQIIEMMQEYLQKKGQDVEAELLNSFASRLTLSQTPEEVDADVKNLLANLSSLSITPAQGESGANADLSTTTLNKELHDLKSGISNIFAGKGPAKRK